MKKTLIYYKPEHIEVAVKLRENYLAHHHEEVDIISENEQDDVEYARKMNYNEAIFVEDPETVIIHDIKTWYTQRLPVSDVYYEFMVSGTNVLKGCYHGKGIGGLF